MIRARFRDIFSLGFVSLLTRWHPLVAPIDDAVDRANTESEVAQFTLKRDLRAQTSRLQVRHFFPEFKYQLRKQL